MPASSRDDTGTAVESDAVEPGAAEAGSDPAEAFSYGAEIKRKALHLLALVVPVGMGWLGNPAALYVLVPVTALAVGADVLRAYSVPFNRFIRSLFGPLMREEELPEVGTGVVVNGASCVLVGATVLAALFPMDIAVPVFVMTMIADAAAALVGRRMGRHPWPGSSHTMEGSAAFVATGLAVLAFFPSVSLPAAAVGVIAGAAVEAGPLPVNDNIRVPVVSALVIVLLQ